MPTLLRGRDTKRKNDLAQIAASLEAYINDKGRYPASDASGRIMGCGTDAVKTACTWGGEFAMTSGTSKIIYMAVLPKDSKVSNGRGYIYQTGANGKAWKLYANLENAKDPVLMTFSPTVSCGTAGNCNYGVSSSNISMTTNLSSY